MSDSIRAIAGNAAVLAARARDEKQYFGQGWSHYPTAFRHTSNGVQYYLSVYNTPKHIQVNWSVSDEVMPSGGAGRREWPYGEAWLVFALTPEESRGLADELGLSISDWLAGALASCQGDTTAESMARDGNVIDLPSFHASRAN